METLKSPLAGLPANLIVSAEEVFGKGWFFLKWTAVYKTDEERKRLRLRFRSQRREFFREVILRGAAPWLLRKIRQNPLAWERHHALPVIFGGDDKRCVLAEDVAHACVHLHINRQIDDLQPHERRQIEIPVRRGLIWDSTTILPSMRAACVCYEWQQEEKVPERYVRRRQEALGREWIPS